MTKITYLSMALCLYSISFSYGNRFIAENPIATTSVKPQRVSIHCITPSGHIRHLLLAFTPDNVASDDYDYGYDAGIYDNIPDDLNWLINDKRYVIQGVGAFEDTKTYPLGMFLTNSGAMRIGLTELENFDSPIDIYIHDKKLNTYTKINDTRFTAEMKSGEYKDRFFIAFKDMNSESPQAALNTNEFEVASTEINYLAKNKEIVVKSEISSNIRSVTLFSILGQKLFAIKNVNHQELRINTDYIQATYGILRVETDRGLTTKKLILN